MNTIPLLILLLAILECCTACCNSDSSAPQISACSVTIYPSSLDPDNPLYSIILCENAECTTSCPDSKLISVESATFGRTSARECGGNGDQSSCYYYCTDIAQSSWNGENYVVLQATVALFKDPCPQHTKYLTLDYRCVS